jgi:hypothetical protein
MSTYSRDRYYKNLVDVMLKDVKKGTSRFFKLDKCLSIFSSRVLDNGWSFYGVIKWMMEKYLKEIEGLSKDKVGDVLSYQSGNRYIRAWYKKPIALIGECNMEEYITGKIEIPISENIIPKNKGDNQFPISESNTMSSVVFEINQGNSAFNREKAIVVENIMDVFYLPEFKFDEVFYSYMFRQIRSIARRTYDVRLIDEMNANANNLEDIYTGGSLEGSKLDMGEDIFPTESIQRASNKTIKKAMNGPADARNIIVERFITQGFEWLMFIDNNKPDNNKLQEVLQLAGVSSIDSLVEQLKKKKAMQKKLTKTKTRFLDI